MHAAVDAAGLTVAADPISRGHAQAFNAALIAFFFEHPAATAGDAAFLVALKATGGKGGAYGVAAACGFGIAAGAAGAVKGKALAVGGADFEVGFVATHFPGRADGLAALADQAT